MGGNKGRCEVIRAFLKGRSKTKGNYSTDGLALLLFGHEIARWAFHKPDEDMSDFLLIRDAGYRTRTTKGALNDLLRFVGAGWGIVQSKHVWYTQRGCQPVEPWYGSAKVQVFNREQGDMWKS